MTRRLKLRGSAFCVGDWVHESSILGPLAATTGVAEAAASVDPAALGGFGVRAAQDFGAGDVVVAGRGFGWGTRDDRAAVVLDARGVGAVVCESAFPVFSRSAHRIGLPVLEVPGVRAETTDGDELIVGVEAATVENLRLHRVFVGPAVTGPALDALRRATGRTLLGLDDGAVDSDVMEIPGRLGRG